jgi:hypothetical protein
VVFGVVRDKILTRIIRECRHEAGLPVQSRPTACELEMAWVIHGGIFFYGVRKCIYESPVLEGKAQMISDALDISWPASRGFNQTLAPGACRWKR